MCFWTLRPFWGFLHQFSGVLSKSKILEEKSTSKDRFVRLTSFKRLEVKTSPGAWQGDPAGVKKMPTPTGTTGGRFFLLPNRVFVGGSFFLTQSHINSYGALSKKHPSGGDCWCFHTYWLLSTDPFRDDNMVYKRNNVFELTNKCWKKSWFHQLVTRVYPSIY